MTVLPELERQLVRAAAQVRSGGPHRAAGVGRRGFAALAVGCAVAVAVVVVFAVTGVRHPGLAGHRRPPHPVLPLPVESFDPTVPATYAQACAAAFDCLTVPAGPVPIALRRPFHLPRLTAGQRCPTTAGTRFSNSELGGVGLGAGPVRPAFGNRGDLVHGRVVLGTTNIPGWYGIKTVWYSLPSYTGPWSVRAARLSGRGRIDLSQVPAPRPGPEPPTGGSPFSRTAVGVSPGDTLNTGAGYRTDPRTTWITGPGCYAFEVDGLHSHELIVFQALVPGPFSGLP
ncbi:MAG: hypothetical protein JO027_07470 [Solirubrobacterales bacterium]|nr:hypothetical protein [Solirubrobacterales bacterium]